ncbi:hypothetical protein MTO96_037240, partial [Rhipicephalus appendiculatus]
MPWFSRSSDSQSVLSAGSDRRPSRWTKWTSNRPRRHEADLRDLSAVHAPVGRRRHRDSSRHRSSRRSPRRRHQRRRRGPHERPVYMRSSRHARVPQRMFFASESSSTEDQSEDDEVAWERTLCVALLAFAAALLVSAVALIIVSRGVPTGQQVSVHYKHLLRAPVVGAPARHVKRRQLMVPGGTRSFGGKPRLQGAFPAAAIAAIEAVDASPARDDAKASDSITGNGSFNKDRYRCDTVFFKFCTTPRREFYFSRAANACVLVGSNPGVQLCNRGANRYASVEDCSFDCVRTPRPSRRCFKTDIFTTCS